MACPTCDHTMQNVGDLRWWCPRCGTLKMDQGEFEKVHVPKPVAAATMRGGVSVRARDRLNDQRWRAAGRIAELERLLTATQVSTHERIQQLEALLRRLVSAWDREFGTEEDARAYETMVEEARALLSPSQVRDADRFCHCEESRPVERDGCFTIYCECGGELRYNDPARTWPAARPRQREATPEDEQPKENA